MIKVYVAGKYSDTNVVAVLKNIGIGERFAADLFGKGFAPFCPWHDKDFIIKRPFSNYTVEQFYEYSIVWLKCCDCILLVPGWETSKGTLEEIRIAKENDIPVFETMEELLEFRKVTEQLKKLK